MAETTDQFASRLGIENGLADINSFRVIQKQDGLWYGQISVHSNAGWHDLPTPPTRTFEEAESTSLNVFDEGRSIPDGTIMGSLDGEFTTEESRRHDLVDDADDITPQEGIVHGLPEGFLAGGE